MGFSFKEWYQANGERLNNNRRDRYQSDPEYRKQVLERNRASRERRRDEVKKERKEEKDALVVKVSAQPWKTIDMEIEVEGKKTIAPMLTIGAVAKAVGRSVQAIRLWEKQGKLPTTPYHNSKGDRLYTLSMVEEIVSKLKVQGKIDDTPSKSRYMPRGLSCILTLSDGSVREEMMFRIGVLAQYINRTVITVEQMEQKEYIPKTPFRFSSTQYRLYTIDMIEAVKTAVDSNEDVRGAAEWKRVYDDIYRRWKALGIIGAQLELKK